MPPLQLHSQKVERDDLISCHFINHISLRPNFVVGGGPVLMSLGQSGWYYGHVSGNGLGKRPTTASGSGRGRMAAKPVALTASAACGRCTNAANLLLINLPASCRETIFAGKSKSSTSTSTSTIKSPLGGRWRWVENGRLRLRLRLEMWPRLGACSL